MYRIAFEATRLGDGPALGHALEEVAKDADHCPELQHLIAFIRASKRGIPRP